MSENDRQETATEVKEKLTKLIDDNSNNINILRNYNDD
jgi:hypothetical protein